MENTARYTLPPLGSIVDRYLVNGFLRVFVASLLCFTSLFAVVEFFDRIGTLIEAEISVSTALRYLVYKIPLSISRIIGFATLFSTLFFLGMLSKTQEITAMRAGGLSTKRISLPLLCLSFLICISTFIWNEGLVPVFAHRAQTIYKTEIKKKQQQSLFGTKDIWIRGEDSFINIDSFDPKDNTLEGITIFSLNRDFSLQGLIDVPTARWTGETWKSESGTEWRFLPDGKMAQQKVTKPATISETPNDLMLLARDAEEFTFFDLQKQIADMKSKGMDATAYEVDLQIKLAIPFISPLMILIAIPFALRKRAGSGLALSFGVAVLIGFGYWVLSAFCFSLGHSGALPAAIAAWLPNSIFALMGIYSFTSEE
ncbi:MAG: LPS export ABC transporter permease LptG [Candidatus Binatia bacterium]